MAKASRKTRSATRLEKHKRVQIFIKREEDTKTTNISTNKEELGAISSSDPIVKVEEKDGDLKTKLGSGGGW